MPLRSKVMRMSIVAVGAVGVLIFEGVEILGAKADDRSCDIFCGDQVAVILSLKSLEGSVSEALRSDRPTRDYCYMAQRYSDP